MNTILFPFISYIGTVRNQPGHAVLCQNVLWPGRQWWEGKAAAVQGLIRVISGGCSVTVCPVIATSSVGMAEMRLLPESCPILVLHLLSRVTSSSGRALQFPVNNAIITRFRWQLERKRLLHNAVSNFLVFLLRFNVGYLLFSKWMSFSLSL